MKWILLTLALVVHTQSASAQDCNDGLSEVATTELLDHGTSDAPPSATLLQAALREAGSSLPSVKVIVLPPWLEARHAESDGPGVYGESVGRRRVLVFGIRAGSLRRAGHELIAEWDDAFRDAYLVAVNTNGGLTGDSRGSPHRNSRRARSRLARCNGPRRATTTGGLGRSESSRPPPRTLR